MSSLPPEGPFDRPIPEAPGSSTRIIPSAPLVLQGIGGAPGVAVARALVLGDLHTAYVQRRIERGHEDAELARLSEAVELAKTGLRDVSARAATGALRDERAILDAYLMMLDDPMLKERVEKHIRRERMCAEWAVAASARDLSLLFEAVGESGDAYIRERRHDIEFVCERLLRALGGEDGVSHLELCEPTIVIATDLSPADTAAMGKTPALGFVTERGSRTSHTAIMARALEIPAVVGVSREALSQIQTGDWVVVDGTRGTVTVHPSPALILEAKHRGERQSAFSELLRSHRERPAQTKCGERVWLRANVELESEVTLAMAMGADGIGLYRTEFLYVDRTTLPSEDEQYAVFRKVLETTAGRSVTLRTFDLGGDKFASAFVVPREMNPALGLRAIRLALATPEVFLTQLRAMLRATVHGDVRIMVPMVTTLGEFRQAKKLFEQAIRECAERGHAIGNLPAFGMMIEVPSAAVLAKRFACEADFFSIGTNDLVQYALAVDRTSERLAGLASANNPAILHLIEGVVTAGRERAISVALCGAMAQELFGALLLVGLGLRELSMGPGAIPQINEALSRIELRECEEVARRALDCDTTEEVDDLLARTFGKRLTDLVAGEPQ